MEGIFFSSVCTLIISKHCACEGHRDGQNIQIKVLCAPKTSLWGSLQLATISLHSSVVHLIDYRQKLIMKSNNDKCMS